MKSFKIFLTFCFVAIIASCIEPIDLDTESSKTESLVISGLITDDPGPYKVELSLSRDFFDSDPIEMVSDALVTIEDDLGKISILEESSSGIYLTNKSEITGQVGRKYKLTVKLQDGRIFQSLPEELLSNPGMGSIYTKFKTKTVRNNIDILVPQEGLEVFIDSNPSLKNQSFYRWRWVGTYEILTYPELAAEGSPSCSGRQISGCTCCTCWIEEYSSAVLLADSKLAQGGQKRVSIDFIEIDEWRFHKKYHIYVEQISLTRSGYDFWKSVEDQQQQGSLFDPTLATVASNITAVNNEDKVLGYFGASSIKSISKFTLRSEIPFFINELKSIQIGDFVDSRFVFRGSCLTYDENSTNIKPDFW